MKTKPYKARSLPAAQRRVRELTKVIEQYRELTDRWHLERKLLAMLAANGPCFFNPMDVMRAEQLRDDILRKDCRMTPDGKPL